MRKRRLILVASLGALIALLITAALRKPSLGSDISLVRGVQPFSYEVKPLLDGGPDLLERVYVLRMPYKDAVKLLAQEMPKAKWNRIYSLVEADFDSKMKTDEFVVVTRSLRLSGHVRLRGRSTIADFSEYVDQPDIDPRGWITVRTFRQMNAWTKALSRIRKWIGQPLKRGPAEYTILTPQLTPPLKRDLSAPDVEKDACEVTWISEGVSSVYPRPIPVPVTP